MNKTIIGAAIGSVITTLVLTVVGLGTALWLVSQPESSPVAASEVVRGNGGAFEHKVKVEKPTKAEKTLVRKSVKGTKKIRVVRNDSGEKVLAAWVPHYNIVALLGVTDTGEVVALNDFTNDQSGLDMGEVATKVEITVVIEAVAPDYYDPENESWDSIQNPEDGYSSSDSAPEDRAYSSSDSW